MLLKVKLYIVVLDNGKIIFGKILGTFITKLGIVRVFFSYARVCLWKIKKHLLWIANTPPTETGVYRYLLVCFNDIIPGVVYLTFHLPIK